MNAFKKSALFIALAAAAFGAQAVEVYGTADVGYSFAKVPNSKVNAVVSGGKSDSFIGFKSTEDLGNGLKAVVTLEAGYNLDTGVTATNLFNREVSLGLTSGAHSLKAGRLLTPGYATVKQFDVFGGGNMGVARGISRVAEYADNAVGYSFAKDGFKAGVQHAFGERVNGGNHDFSTLSLNAGYEKGPLSAALTHTNVDAGVSADVRVTQVAGAYDFGVAKASLLYQDAKNSTVDRSYLFGVKAPVAGFVALASAGQAKLPNGSKVNLYSVGGEYSLSKRTTLYAAYGRVAAVTTGQQLGMGMNHSF
jgi:predicted porin